MSRTLCVISVVALAVGCGAESVPPSEPGGGSGGMAAGGAGSGGVAGTQSAGKSGGGGTAPTTGGSSAGGSSGAGQAGTGNGGVAGSSPGGAGSGGSGAMGGAAGTSGGSGGAAGSGGGTAASGGSAGDGSGGSAGDGSGGTSGASGASGAAGSSAGAAGSAGAGGPPGEKTLRVFYVHPTDVPLDQRFPDGIADVILEAQSYYKAELGVTFRVNDPIVEVVAGEREASYYETSPVGGDSYWYTAENMRNELLRRFDLRAPDSRWKLIGIISSPGNGGGGSGWVMLTKHDADGAAGLRNEPMSRWWGGMVHEMGHMFGLPDSTSTDGTPMSASFYEYPNCHFSESQKNSILNSQGNSGFLE